MSPDKTTKSNVLIAEDSPTQAEHLKFILEKAGYEVSVATNGKEALLLLETTHPKIVISDIVMPEMDGYELCRRIKQDKRFNRIPVILVTVLYDPQDVIRGLECGADNFIPKPYDEKYLLSRIEVVLAGYYADETEKVQIGLDISFAGNKHHITASRLQIVNMLLSTYETAVQKNQELTDARDKLRELNEHLEDLVAERTLELEKTNSQLLKEVEVRKKAEEEIRRSNRALRVISECNQFLVRTSDAQDLITGICKILVTEGKYRCAWVGYSRNDKDKTVEPVAQSGFEEDYLKNFQISWKKGRHGKGPTGTAIRTGEPRVVRNIPDNPKCGSWSSEAIKREYSTVAAFPLIIEEQVIGALTIYASEPEAFDSDELQLLSEMSGDLAFGIASIRIKMERNEVEKALQHSEEKFREIFNNANDAIEILEFQENGLPGKYLDVNDVACQMLQYTREELLNLSPFDISTEYYNRHLKDIGEELRLIGNARFETEHKRKDGTIIPVEINSRVVTLQERKVNLAVVRDITERMRSEEELKISLAKYKVLFESLPIAITISDNMGNIVESNKRAEEILGLSDEEQSKRKIDGTEWQLIRPDGTPMPADEYASVRALKEERLVQNVEMGIVKENSAVTWIDVTAAPIPLKDYGVAIAYSDITERKKAEEQLKHFNEELEKQVAERTEALNKTLQEKDVLFKEVHHRVKNNMQIIISLLNLQSRTIDDPVVLKTIKDSQSRIRAMALVHERLYRSGDISRIDLKDYIQFLSGELFSFYGVKSNLVHLTINAPAIMVNIDTAIPLGLMVNELISNAIKHAFPDDRKGEIVIDITKDKHEISLVVRDNGVGIPADFDWHNAKSLGIRLVNSLVEQLQGTIEVDRTGGTAFNIVVKEKE